MSRIDLRFSYEELLFVKEAVTDGPDPSIVLPEVPEGFALVPDPLMHEEDWVQIMVNTGMFETAQQARDAFQAMKQQDPDLMDRSFFLLLDSHQQPAGAIAIWYGRHLETIPWRIHYLAVDPAFQNRHLASWLVDYANAWHARHMGGPLYLSTQMQSWRAIRLYLAKGFLPLKTGWKDCAAPEAINRFSLASQQMAGLGYEREAALLKS